MSDNALKILCGALLLCGSAFAHNSGHGPEIAGKGPRGGVLSAVVSATEAELGASARVKAVAETIRRGNSYEVILWDETRKQKLEVAGAGEVKWIVLGEKIPNAIVLLSPVDTKNPQLKYSFSPEILDRASSIEVILPGTTSAAEKQVFMISVENPTQARQ